jgi:hypothetical protein
LLLLLPLPAALAQHCCGLLPAGQMMEWHRWQHLLVALLLLLRHLLAV